MADTKISALTAATGGNASDVVPIVQGGTTKKLALKELFSGATGGQISFPATQNASADANTLDDYEEGTYTVTWTGSGGNPAIGDGTLSGFYTKKGREVTAVVTLLCGSTTTFGTGNYAWSLPFTASASVTSFVGAVYALDSGTAHFVGVIKANGGGATFAGYTNNAGTEFSTTAPFTWAANDTLYASITYFV